MRTVDRSKDVKKNYRLIHRVLLATFDPSDLDTDDLDQWVRSIKEKSKVHFVPGLEEWERISVSVTWDYENVSIVLYGHYTESDEEYFNRIEQQKIALKARRKKERADKKERQLKQEAEERLLFERLRKKYGP